MFMLFIFVFSVRHFLGYVCFLWFSVVFYMPFVNSDTHINLINTLQDVN